MKFWANIATLLVASACAIDNESFGRSDRVEKNENDRGSLVFEDEMQMERLLELSMSVVFVPTTRVFGKAKDGKSKSKDGKTKSKDGKSKSKSKDGAKDGAKDGSKDGWKSKSNKDYKTLRTASKDGKEGQKKTKDSEQVKTGERLFVTKMDKGHRNLGIGFAEEARFEEKSKSGKAKSGSKAGKKEKRVTHVDMYKLSLPYSKSDEEPYVPYTNRKLTPAPSDSPMIKTGTKRNSRRYKVRRREQAVIEDDISWRSNHRELGDHCLIGSPSTVSGRNGMRLGSKETNKSGSKTGSKYGGKTGSKDGSKSGRGVDRRDKGRRRTEMGLYACELSGSWTCCKEYGDMGDDPVCCKVDSVEPVNGRLSHSRSNGSSSQSVKNSGTSPNRGPSPVNPRNSDSGTSTTGESFASQGPERVDPSYSNDIPPPLAVSTRPAFDSGGPLMVRAQDPVTMKVEHDWESNDQN